MPYTTSLLHRFQPNPLRVQKRCAGADFARWPIFSLRSCRLMVGFIIPLPPLFVRRMPPVGPLCSASVTRHHHYYGPIRQTPTFIRLCLLGSSDYLAPRDFSAGWGVLPCFKPMALCACCRSLLRQVRSTQTGSVKTLLPSPRL